MKRNLMNMVKAAAFAAVICVATMLVPIPLPGGGYANAGDTLVIAAGFFCGPIYGFLAAAIGSCLADIFLGAAVYAPATFLIKGIMALAVALICRNKFFEKNKFSVLISAVIAEVIMVAGYFVFELFIYSTEVAVVDIPGNAVQGVCGIVLSSVIVGVLRRNKNVCKFLKI